MTEASIPPQPTQPGPAGLLPNGGDTADGGIRGALDAEPDDLVIEDLTDASWPAVTPRICICTFSGE
jgi:hypothetical protein